LGELLRAGKELVFEDAAQPFAIARQQQPRESSSCERELRSGICMLRSILALYEA
jgi:hypothetical protein